MDIRRQKLLTLKTALLALVASLVAMSVFFVNACQEWSLGLEGSLLGRYEVARSAVTVDYGNMPSDALLVNVAYDRQLTDISDELGIPVGNTDITDRNKLFRLLSALHRSDDYRYILLDVELCADGCHTSIDDSLCQLIGSMSRIVLPDGGGVGLLPPRLQRKSAPAVYVTNIINNKCSKYPLIYDGRPSVALQMYEETAGVNLSPSLFMYSDGRGCLPGNLPLSVRYYINGAYTADGEKNYYNMGADLLGEESGEALTELAKGKMVLIGDFVERDMHATYRIDLPGILVHYNVWRSLMEHRAYMSFWLLALLLLMCFAITIAQLKGFSFADMLSRRVHIDNAVWRASLTWLDYTLLLEVIMLS